MKTRTNISTEIANTLRDMIFDKRLEEGARINEVHLAAELNVSRTPLREALATLLSEGAIYNIPRRGFFIRELTQEEFEDLYPIRSILDPEALRLAGIPEKQTLGKLRLIDKKMRAAGRSKTRTSLDDEWHLLLLSGCPNRVLLDLIKQLMGRFRRYGLAFLRDGNVLETANREHDEIIRLLESGDMDGACTRLRRNLTSNTQPIIEWLQKRG